MVRMRSEGATHSRSASLMRTSMRTSVGKSTAGGWLLLSLRHHSYC